MENKALEYHYRPLVESDDFKDECAVNKERYGCFGLKSVWQFNHEPDLSLVQRDLSEGILWITTDKLCKNLTQAKNTLTQRMLFPGCEGEVTIEAAYLKEGDYAGICAFQSCYGMAALTRRDGRLYVMKARKAEDGSLQAMDISVPVFMGEEGRLSDVEGQEISFAARYLIDEAMKADEKSLFVLFLGAITNIVSAMKACSDIMSSGVDLWLIPINVYGTMHIGLAEIQRRIYPCGKIGKHLFENMISYNLSEHAGWTAGESWSLGDSPAVGVVLEANMGIDYIHI